MSPSFSTAESEWLAQVAAMREAIAEIKLTQPITGAVESYGQHIVSEDDDWELNDRSLTDEIWDIFSEDDDEVNGGGRSGSTSNDSDNEELEATFVGGEEGLGYDLEWLQGKCLALTDRQSSGLDSSQLQDHLHKLLLSEMGSKSWGIYRGLYEY